MMLQAAGHVISSVDVRATFGECGLNSGRIIPLFDRPDPFYAPLCAVFNIILQPSEATGNVMSVRFQGSVVPDRHVKFGCPRLDLSRDIPPEAV